MKFLRKVELLSTIGCCSLSIIDSRIEAVNVTVIGEYTNERQEVCPLEAVFIKIFWRTITGCNDDHSTSK